MTRRVRVGLAGLGRIHAASLSARCPSARLACVVDTDPGIARQLGEQLEVPSVRSYEEILATRRSMPSRSPLRHRFMPSSASAPARPRSTSSARSRSLSTGGRASGALPRALDRGPVAAAGLDVFEEEPPAADLLGRPNLLLSSHSAYYSEEAIVEL